MVLSFGLFLSEPTWGSEAGTGHIKLDLARGRPSWQLGTAGPRGLCGEDTQALLTGFPSGWEHEAELMGPPQMAVGAHRG